MFLRRKVNEFLIEWKNNENKMPLIIKSAIYENIVADMLAKQGYPLYFYRNEKGTLKLDFFVRDENSLIPVEVKTNDALQFH